MKNKRSRLVIALGLQLLIAVAMFLSTQLGSRTFTPEALFNIDRSRLNQLVIHESDKTLNLSKQGDQWFFTDKDLAIDQNKFNRLVDSLLELKTTWPVTTTASSHQRFEVSDDEFRKKITLKNGNDTLATLFVGNAPGFKQVHLRLDGQQEVYALDFDAFSVSANEDDWLNTSMLSISGPKKIMGRDFTLQKTDDSWQTEPQSKDNEVIQNQAENLAQAIESISITGLASENVLSENVPSEKDGIKELNIENENQKYIIKLFNIEEKYYIQRTDIDHIFELSKFNYDRLVNPDLNSLTRNVTSEPNSTEEMDISEESTPSDDK